MTILPLDPAANANPERCALFSRNASGGVRAGRPSW